MSEPANAEMIEGYNDGRNADSPEPSANRSASYRHGFLAGRSDLLGPQHHGFTFDQMTHKATAAMAADAMNEIGVGKP